MPILCLPDISAPLSQGDILRDVITYVTDEGGNPSTNKDSPGHVMVLSRPCAAVRDGTVVVAEIRPAFLVDKARSAKSLDELKKALTLTRDGAMETERFYIGELPGQGGQRYAVRFDSIHTVTIPRDEERRKAFLLRHRVAVLAQDFAKDLHLRFSVAFAKLGFDDNEWYSDADLDLMIGQGEADLAMARASLVGAEAGALAVAKEATRLQAAGGGEHDERKTQDADKKVQEATKAVRKAETALAPFLAERERRRAHRQ